MPQNLTRPEAKSLSTLIEVGDAVSLALETNGRGFHGFIVELPGAFVRGPTESEAISKVQKEADCYLRWTGRQAKPSLNIKVVQRHTCKLMVEDADCEILLASDRGPVTNREFKALVELANYSGQTLTELYDSAQLKDWVDEARIRPTFYGANKKTIGEIFDHVRRTQFYYLSRSGVPFTENEADPFMKIREFSMRLLSRLYRENTNSKVYTVDNEEWTIKKILRRFIWHDRIHGKAIVRILQKQKSLGLTETYKDPFSFELA